MGETHPYSQILHRPLSLLNPFDSLERIVAPI